MDHYSLEFGTSWEGETADIRGITTTVKTQSPPTIYVNWDCDILVPVNFSYHRLARGDIFGNKAIYVNRLRRIALQDYFYDNYYAYELLPTLRLQTNLAEITVYVTDLEYKDYFNHVPYTLTFIKPDASDVEDYEEDLNENRKVIEQLTKEARERGELVGPLPVIRLLKLIAIPRDT